MKFISLIALFFSISVSASTLLPLQYKSFTIALDCESRLPLYVHYKATVDEGNFERSSSFYLDSNVPSSCQQASTSSYKIPYKIYTALNQKISYDRGHLVPANHMDSDKESIKESNFMTNIVPMTSVVNRRGAWRETEKLTECLRDKKQFDVHAGVIIGNNTEDDYFISSHGVPTPDYLWKVLSDGESVAAWIIPNSIDAIKEKLPSYRVTVSDIEKSTGLILPIKSHVKNISDYSQWAMPSKCDLR